MTEKPHYSPSQLGMFGKCSFSGCERKRQARGLCAAHIAQVYRGKALAPLEVQRGRFNDADYSNSFWRRVRKGDGCWEWTGRSNKGNGYGMASLPGGVCTGSHRASWILHFGPIPKGQFVCHRCDNKRCVRPDHLFLGDARANLRDCFAKGLSRNVKLTKDETIDICTLSTMGATTSELARQFGVARFAITNTIAKQRWMWT